MPLSNRGIGDDRFYAYGGYRTVEGEDPTKLVYDKPALGIWFIGIFSYFLQNPAYSGLFFGLGILLLLYGIVYKVSKNVVISVATPTLLLLDPLFFSHLSTSLLDLPQLFFLLLNIYSLMIFTQNKKLQLLFVFIAGLSLGIFAQIKIPVIYPLILLFEIIILYKKLGKTIAAVFLLGNAFSVFIGYLPYLFQGYSFIEFINIQKFVIAFYRDSNLPLHIHAIWQYMFTGFFPGIADGIPSRVAEWTLVLPVAVVASIVFGAKVLKTRKYDLWLKLFVSLIFVCLLIFTFIPSFPRYLILILPFLYFFLVKVLFTKKQNSALVFSVIAIMLYSLVNTFLYFHQSPSDFLKYFYNNISYQYFHDIYQEQIDSSKEKYNSREIFQNINQSTLSQATVKEIQIKEGEYNYSVFDQTVSIPVEITYKTAFLGEFKEKKNIIVVRQNDKWKVVWDWAYLLNGYSPDKKIESKRIIGKRGSILTKDGDVVAEDNEGYLISINPKLMEGIDEAAMLKELKKLSFISEPSLQNAYIENPLQNSFIPLFTTFTHTTDLEINKLSSFKSLRIEEYPTRTYYTLSENIVTNTLYKECCTRIYSSTNYHGNKDKPGNELTYDKQLSGHDGGYIRIIDQNNKVVRTILEKTKKDGNDVTLKN